MTPELSCFGDSEPLCATQVGLTEKVHTKAGELSGGQKRKLSLCLALIGKVQTVILDEPTSGTACASVDHPPDRLQMARMHHISMSEQS